MRRTRVPAELSPVGAVEIAMRLWARSTDRMSERDAYAALLELEGARTRYRMIR
jgi:hypothetical protein